jgi:hypothetical protein
MTNTPATLSGRCANGNEADQGSVVHLIADNGYTVDYSHRRALCGREPGRRSAGWTSRPIGTNVTCKRCAKAGA